MAFDISQQQQNTSGDQERMAARAGPCLGGDRVTAQGEQGSIAERVGVPGLSQHLVHFVGVQFLFDDQFTSVFLNLPLTPRCHIAGFSSPR